MSFVNAHVINAKHCVNLILAHFFSPIIVILEFFLSDIFVLDGEVVQKAARSNYFLGFVWRAGIQEMKTAKSSFQMANATFHHASNGRMDKVVFPLSMHEVPVISEWLQ